jgi:hypothetical protein
VARSGVGASPGVTASPRRFQQVFVTGVAVFLALTGGVKLVSIMQETRALGAPDPLFSGLTVRQVLLAAAALELGVAAVLFRHRPARWAPGLILWLVAVFGAYRLGLWAMGFQGHCGCLGHLFDRLPGLEVWADRVMLAALFVMGVGAIGCLCIRSRFKIKREVSLPHGAEITCRVVIFSVVSTVSSLPLLAATRDAAEGASPVNAAWRIGARGQAKFSYLERNQQEHLRFEIITDGQRVSARLAGFSKTGLHSDIAAQEFHFDGELGQTLLIWSPDHLVPQMVIDPETKQPRGDTNTLVRPLNDATMELRFSPIPKAGNLLPPWLAFASLPYLEAWSGGHMEKLFDLDRTRRREPLIVPGVLKRAPQPPQAPELLITFDPRNRTLTNEVFRVEEWQRLGDQTWPKRFVFQLYQSHSEPKGRLLTVSEWTVEELFVPEAAVTGKPQFQGRLDVKDERFNQDPVPLPIVGYFTTDSVVPPVEAVRTMRAYEAQVHSEQTRQRQTRISNTWPWIFGPLLAAPAIWYLVRRYNSQRNNRKTHPTP